MSRKKLGHKDTVVSARENCKHDVMFVQYTWETDVINAHSRAGEVSSRHVSQVNCGKLSQVNKAHGVSVSRQKDADGGQRSE